MAGLCINIKIFKKYILYIVDYCLNFIDFILNFPSFPALQTKHTSVSCGLAIFLLINPNLSPFTSLTCNTRSQKIFVSPLLSSPDRRQNLAMAFTFAAFSYISALIIDAFLLFFSIFHVSWHWIDLLADI